MIHTSFASSITEMDKLIMELEKMYKNFDIKTIVPISSGYVLYYTIKEDKK